jgi:hypothetical protein
MLETIPAELGRVIPQPSVRCSQCRRPTLEIDKDDAEPLCCNCRIADRQVGMAVARTAALARERVHELVIPIERDLERPPRFGTRSGEIDSCDLVLRMRHAKDVDRDASLCRRMTWAFFGFEALLLILAAAAMR